MPRPAFRCRYCPAIFTRQEHLSRHTRTHTREKPYPCSQCDKSFSRRDVLGRHLESHKHGLRESASLSARACLECAAIRVRCSKDAPCRRCQDRRLECVYPPARKTVKHGQATVDHQETPQARLSAWPPQAVDNVVGQPEHFAALNEFGSGLWNDGAATFGLSGLNWLSPQFQLDGDWDASMFDWAAPLQSSTIVEVPDWHQPVTTSSPVPAVQPSPQASVQTTPPLHSHVSPAGSRMSDGALYVDGRPGRAPFGGLLRHRHALGSDRSIGSPTSSDEASMVNIEAHHSLCQGLNSFKDAATNTPPLEIDLLTLQYLVMLYFKKFHPAYPFLRQSHELFEGVNGWRLLLAVATVGDIWSGDARIPGLHGVLMKVLDDLALPSTLEADHDDGRGGVHMLQIGVLGLIAILHGPRESCRSRLLHERLRWVDYCARRSLLSRSMPREDAAIGSDAWVAGQSRIRTGMMLWLVDSIIAHEFGCPTLFRLHDAKCQLPCIEELWANPTDGRLAEADMKAVTIAEALELLYLEKRLPPSLSDFSTTILVYAICRRMDEASYQHRSVLANWQPDATVQSRDGAYAESDDTWPPSNPNIIRWRNSSCDSLDILHWNANTLTTGTGGWERPMIFHLHLSRLLLLTPVRQIEHVVTHLPLFASRQERDAKLDDAYTSLRRWAVIDQFKARLAIIHSGATLWHLRRYSTGSFAEPFAIYLAILVVWSYSRAAMSYHQPPEAGASRNSSPSHDDEEEQQDDPDHPSFVHLDRPCDDEIVQAYVRVGYKMQGNMVRIGNICSAGAPQKILREGLRMLSDDKQWTRRDLSESSSPGSSFSGQPDAKQHYFGKLLKLAQVTSTW